MKTPEEIKHALECCKKSECHHCPYCLHESDIECNGEMAKDALHLITLLECYVKYYTHLTALQKETIELQESLLRTKTS